MTETRSPRSEPASLVAARQLAEEARARRAAGECAPSAGPRFARQHWMRDRGAGTTAEAAQRG